MRYAKNDKIIRELLASQAITVDEGGKRIRVRNLRHSHLDSPATIEPNVAGYPRMRVSVPMNDGGSKRIWLQVNRVVWYAHEGRPTINNIAFLDEDPWNWHISNLVERDQNDQNYTSVCKKMYPKPETGPVLDDDEDDLPF